MRDIRFTPFGYISYEILYYWDKHYDPSFKSMIVVICYETCVHPLQKLRLAELWTTCKKVSEHTLCFGYELISVVKAGERLVKSIVSGGGVVA